jgi:predicted Fe-Mo cluster-binding NifX family protein
VFDLSRSLDVVDIRDGEAVERRGAALPSDDPVAKVETLVSLGVLHLVCGAVSRPLEVLLASRGITVAPFVCGRVEDVLTAFLQDRLSDPALAMPGCCGRRRWRFGAEGRCMAPDETVHVSACPPYGPHAGRRLGASCNGRRGKG